MNKKSLLVIGVIVLVAFGIYFYNSEYVDLGSEYNKEDLECEMECKVIFDKCTDWYLEYSTCMMEALGKYISCENKCWREAGGTLNDEEWEILLKCEKKCEKERKIDETNCLNKYGSEGNPPLGIGECWENWDDCREGCKTNDDEN